MIEYPKVEHKIPELFSLIIENNQEIEELLESKIPSFKRYLKLKARRQELITGAEKFIQRQKGGNVV